NFYGQLGNGDAGRRTQTSPVLASNLTGTGTLDVLATGAYSTCAVTHTGAGSSVLCWGNDDNGLLGDHPRVVDRWFATQIPAFSNVKVLGGGYSTSCARVDFGTGVLEADCWGYNFDGEFGDGSFIDHAKAGALPSRWSAALQIVAGLHHLCALLGDAVTVECAGFDGDGELGDASNTSSNTPVKVVGLGSGGVTQLVAGDYHTCALLADSTVKCWGVNSTGALGTGDTGGQTFALKSVIGLSGVNKLAAGSYHTCALVSGQIECWGADGYGQLGDGDGALANKSSPVFVTNMTTATDIVAGFNHTCARVGTNAHLQCWGDNTYGQLGIGDSSVSRVNHPIDVDASANLTNVSSLSAGGNTTCAEAFGIAGCWGANDHGQLGIGSADTNSHATPSAALTANGLAMTDIAEVNVGTDHAALARRATTCAAGVTASTGNSVSARSATALRLSRPTTRSSPTASTVTRSRFAFRLHDETRRTRCGAFRFPPAISHGDLFPRRCIP
ncbi:MAG TPA: hypothetical protein VFB32_02565, partial [Rudaea sp.]|nr:hypothetical protein [Rudaea sp.]